MVLLFVLAALVALERSSLVALQDVHVTGVARLDPQAVIEAAALPLGTSTLRLDLGAAEQRVEALPLVGTADLRRLDPLTVQIEVHERIPVAVVEVGRTRLLVDEDGVILARGTADLPTIALGEHTPPSPGDSVDADPALRNAHRVLVGLPGPLRTRVARFEAAGPEELDLVLDDGRRVRFGRADRIDEKARALGAVLEELGDTRVGVIDVRAPSTPVVTR